MNINYKQAQFELFPGTPGSSSETGKPRYLFANLTVSIENLVVFGIAVLMVMLLAFSLGVEKGKQVTHFGAALVPGQSIVKIKPLAVKPTAPIVSAVATEQRAIVPVTLENRTTTKTHESLLNQANVLEKSESKPIAQTESASSINTLSGLYSIQVASYKAEEYAQKESTILKKKGFDGFVLQKGDFFILCVGKFQKKNEADRALGKLKKQYNDSLVRRL